MINFFEIDGRKNIKPEAVYMFANPIKVTASSAKQMCENFKASGSSVHSSGGSTVWVILSYCLRNRIPYKLSYEPGIGYIVSKEKSILSTMLKKKDDKKQK